MTYASAMVDMKQFVGAVNFLFFFFFASLYAVDSATPAQATDLNGLLQQLNTASAILVRLEATPTPTVS